MRHSCCIVLYMNSFAKLLFIVVLFSSCASIDTANYYTDDLYYNNDVTHNFNTSAMLNNENVAMPEDAIVYYDEEESSRINPSFEDRIAAYEENDNSTYEETGREWSQPQSPYVMGAAGMMVSNGSFLVSPYQTYQSPYYGYNNAYNTNYGGGTYYIPPRTTNNQSVVIVDPKPYRPNVSSSRYEADRLAKMRQPIRPIAAHSSSGNSSNSTGYNSNASRKYKTGNNSGTGVWSNPGYHSNSRSNSSNNSNSRSSGSVSGVRRR